MWDTCARVWKKEKGKRRLNRRSRWAWLQSPMTVRNTTTCYIIGKTNLQRSMLFLLHFSGAHPSILLLPIVWQLILRHESRHGCYWELQALTTPGCTATFHSVLWTLITRQSCTFGRNYFSTASASPGVPCKLVSGTVVRGFSAPLTCPSVLFQSDNDYATDIYFSPA